MRSLSLARPGEALDILCLGAHSDDIEIGLGGTILSLIEARIELRVSWCVFSAIGPRAAEAEASASAFLAGATGYRLELGEFEDALFPTQSRAIKEWMINIRGRASPDVIFTHARHDAHQDHREVSALTWNVFRDHLVYEYEIPKWDGDLGRPNAYFPITRPVLERKMTLLREHFGTQRSKDWFDDETFQALARIRGMECRAPDRYAEAFVARKMLLSCDAGPRPRG
ncbi:PIG-L deacetylase family protein [Aurantimonas sp. A2-1-M11]|uniref:PIG-L deacetylase family protein n=1 Tax=Aurantimonas sp. A2-1-M11 TaxID=3113712 RepID=UPI002F94EFC9